MKNKDKITIIIAFMGVIASISSLVFFGFVEFVGSNILKSTTLGVMGSIIGALLATFVLRLSAKAKAPSVFISYHHSNKDIARKIANGLKSISDHVWFYEQNINIGDNIIDKVESGVKNSDYFLIILSDEANKSHWVEAELSKAMKLDKAVFPVKIDNSETPVLIKNIAYADLSTSFESGMYKLKRALIAQAQNKAIKRSH